MDLAAVKDAPALVLARGSVAAAKNARGLVQDAEMLSGAGRLARAYSLAGLAVEEVGKAGSLAALAAMPENLRARAPLGRMLEWHQWKLVTGLLIAAVPVGVPGVAARFVTMPLGEVACVHYRARPGGGDGYCPSARRAGIDVHKKIIWVAVRLPGEAVSGRWSRRASRRSGGRCRIWRPGWRNWCHGRGDGKHQRYPGSKYE